ncbi:alpha/beta fold hydrolase [Nocardia sp. CA-290969]|uniref:alpha/beta fold hydrolase n=1 Tax=Nocardia sp. CA-290969 TaxID=3239986 RepID=UPI003D9399B7
MPKLARDAVELFYHDEGSGEPLVLLHGAASSSVCFDDCAGPLARKRRVVRPDLRGMGRSSRIDSLRPTDWVEDLLALLDHLGLDRVDLAGTSLGARIATRFALDHPDRVMTLTLDAPMVFAEPAGEELIDQIFGPDRDPGMAETLRRWHGADWEAVTSTYLRLRQSRELQEFLDFRQDLERLGMPVLLTRGDDDDPIHPIAHALEIHTRASATLLWIAPSARFALTRFRPQEWARVVDEFIWTHDLGSRAVSHSDHIDKS